MSPFPSPLSAVINHLLAQEPWARDKLVKHGGKVACLDAGALAVRLKVAPDGLVEAARPEETVSVTIRVQLSDLPLILQNREHAFSYVTIDGDADFANTISQLSQSLRWEAEADLSRWVGDIAAVRIASGARAAFDAAKATQRKVTENVVEYLVEEQPVLVRPRAVADFSASVTKLRDDLERLAKRIEKLENRAS